MKALNKLQTKLFGHMIEGLNDKETSRRIGGEIGGGQPFMPVSIEFLYEGKLGKVYSVSHYYEQNGDLMSDPDVTFIILKTDEKIYPMTFRQDNLGIDDVFMLIDSDGNLKYKKHQQKDLGVFCNQWILNIKVQQPEFFKGKK